MLASTLGTSNPLRYRGYYYDSETGLYYLQSRYYNPEIGRFINADSFASTGQGLLGNNMFAYCLNNPVRYKDTQGHAAADCFDTDGEQLSNNELVGLDSGGGIYTPPSGGGGISNSIFANGIRVDFGHGARHLTGYNISDIESHIANDVVTKPGSYAHSSREYLDYYGRRLEYRYYTRSSDHIFVGTYFFTNRKA